MTDGFYFSRVPSPVGELLLVSDGEALAGLHMGPHGYDPEREGWVRDDALLRPAREQLRAYFAGELLDFTVPLALEGTRFQRRVWDELRRIPFGDAVSYAEVARRVGRPTGARAVGSANGRNPVAIIVPCHRVIAADGTLGGYGGGLRRKRWLLDHEAAVRAAGLVG
jgi:methylated-DNA-[protein]-cysteine S-methyltransferase